MEDAELKAILEGLIFVSETPLTVDRMKEVLGAQKRDLQRLLSEMVEDYRTSEPRVLSLRRWPKDFSSAPGRSMPTGSGN